MACPIAACLNNYTQRLYTAGRLNRSSYGGVAKSPHLSPMGRTKFSQSEIDAIVRLLRRKQAGNRYQQKLIRHSLRVDFEFNISDFNTPGQAFGEEELQAAVQRGAIQILDEATIAAMKEKRRRDKERDAQEAPAEEPVAPEADWQQAMKDWEAWERQGGA